jgi:hypothetical protein
MSTKALLLLALAVAACRSDADAKPTTATLADLSKSLDAVRAEFNAHKSEPRFVTLLSAT